MSLGGIVALAASFQALALVQAAVPTLPTTASWSPSEASSQLKQLSGHAYNTATEELSNHSDADSVDKRIGCHANHLKVRKEW